MRKIIITDELKNVLTKINSPISTAILTGVDEDLLTNPEKEFNYFDLSQSTKGHLSYLTKEKIERIEQSENTEEDKLNYWSPKIRYHSRPGSLMKKLLKLNDFEISNFTTQFLSIVDPPVFNMVVVQGVDIAKYYNYQSYADQRGSLGSSCMKSSPDNFFDIYVQNPNQIKMLIMLDQYNKLMGRSIIWSDLKLMDRVYTSNDNHCTYFYDWAVENGYSYKEFNNWNTPKNWVVNENKEIKKYEIQLENVQFDHYPYLDSFKWLDLITKKIYNYVPVDKTNVIIIGDHMGHFYPPDYYNFCDMTNNLFPSSDIRYLDYLNKNVYSGYCVYSNIYSKYIYREHSKNNPDICDMIFSDEFDHLNDWNLILKKKEDLIEKFGSIKCSKNYSNDDLNWWEHTPSPVVGTGWVDDTIDQSWAGNTTSTH